MSTTRLYGLTKHIPPGQLGRYVLIGVWNTVFGYGTFALFTALLNRYMPASYLAGSLIASVLNITVSFLGYKWFVFKTKGNYLREWMRCNVVYGTTTLIGIMLLPVFVFGFRKSLGLDAAAPYVAGATVTGLNVIISFLGHRNFSFRSD